MIPPCPAGLKQYEKNAESLTSLLFPRIQEEK